MGELPKYDPETTLKNEKEKAEWRKNAFEQFKKELLDNPAYHEYAKQFQLNPGMIEEFATTYARDKVTWYVSAPMYKRIQEREELQWVNDAFQRLEEIQQKKLFDMQCLWRAEKLNIPEITCSQDFAYWEFHILNCPFIEKITTEEVEIYQHYMNSLNFEFEQGWLDRWQDYDKIKEADTSNAQRNFPDWYDFYNGRTGKGIYLILPNVRGQKEEFYFNLWRKEYLATNKKKRVEIENNPDAEKRPWMNYHEKGFMKWFVQTYEDKETQKMFEDYGGENPYDQYDDELEKNIDFLSDAQIPLPIQGWYDWREAISKAAGNYRIKKIAEALPEAYDQYCMQYDLKIGFPEEQPDRWKENLEEWKSRIFRGRELNGEPRDFNF